MIVGYYSAIRTDVVDRISAAAAVASCQRNRKVKVEEVVYWANGHVCECRVGCL